MKSIFSAVTVVATMCFLSLPNAAEPEAVAVPQSQPLGQLVLTSCELPQSTSVWDAKKGVADLGIPKPVDHDHTEKVDYWVFLPNDYKEAGQGPGSPLLLFLHGAGERGNNTELVKVHGPPKLLNGPQNEKCRQDWPFLTVAPQCKAGYCWSPGQLLLLLDEVEKRYHIDKSRVYVTGISMGGFGTWMLLNENASRFAAAAPVCGGGDPAWAPKMVDTPIWDFHGDADGLVPLDFSQRMIDALEKADAKEVKLTVYPGVGHDSWTQTYVNPELYRWFLSKRKSR